MNHVPMNSTRHMRIRAQQRGIPPLIDEWLDLYGEEAYVVGGVMHRFFSKRSIRLLEKDVGCAPVRKLSEWLNAYKVEDSSSGTVITIGHRYRRIRRK